MNKLAISIVVGLLSMNSAHAAAYQGADGKVHYTGSFGNHGPVRITSEAEHRAAKRMCLLHVDRFVKGVKANAEDHVRLANHCSNGHFNTVWHLTGGTTEKSVVHNGETVDSWEKPVREAAEKMGIDPTSRIPSESWRKHLNTLNEKVK